MELFIEVGINPADYSMYNCRNALKSMSVLPYDNDLLNYNKSGKCISLKSLNISTFFQISPGDRGPDAWGRWLFLACSVFPKENAPRMSKNEISQRFAWTVGEI